MADFLSRLLNPNPIMNQSGGASPMPFPQMQPQEMQAPGFGQNFKSNIGPILQALGMGIASNDLGRGAAMIPGLVDNRQQRQAQIQEQQQAAQQRNATAQWFRTKDPEIAAMLDQGIIDGKTALSMWQQKQQGAQPGNQPASIQEYEYAKQNGFEGSFMDFQEGKRGQGVTYGTSPQWYQDPQGGGWKYGVTGTDGTFKEVALPPGVKLEGPEGVAAARSRGTVVGEASGKAQAALPIASATAQRAISMADQIVQHPSFESSVGPIQGRLPDYTAGRKDFASRVQQLRDLTFMQARQELKGGGAITDFEGQKAENALLRAERATDENAYRQAIEDYKAAIIRGYQLLEEQAGMTGGNVVRPGIPPAAGAEDPLGLR